MVKHMILWQFAEHLNEEEKDMHGKRIKEGLEALYGRIDGLLDIHVYLNSMPSSNYDILLECTMKDKDALQYYAAHPEHVQVKDSIIVPVTRNRVCFDYEL